MAYDFIGLVNDVNARLNEVQLTSSNFANAVGFYQQAKEAVNSSIRYVNQSQYEWPFNHVEQEDVLTAGTIRYAFPTDMKTPDMDTFRIKRDDTLGNATP
jgi:predicted patatin/cPLA2 family phospholipase